MSTHMIAITTVEPTDQEQTWPRNSWSKVSIQKKHNTGSQERGGARRSQEKPGGAMRSQDERGGARRSQEEPGGASEPHPET